MITKTVGQRGLVLAKRIPKSRKAGPRPYQFYQTMVIRRESLVPKTKLPTHLVVKAHTSTEAAQAVVNLYRQMVDGKTKSIKIIRIYTAIAPKQAGVFVPEHPALAVFHYVQGKLVRTKGRK